MDLAVPPIYKLPAQIIAKILSHCDGTSIFRFLYMTVQGSLPTTWAILEIPFLDLSHSNASNRVLGYFGRSPIVVVTYIEISLINCKAITSSGFKYLPPTVKSINFSGCHKVNDKGVLSLDDFKELECLNFSFLKLSDATIKHVIAHHKVLKQLNLFGATKLSEQLLLNLTKNPQSKVQVDIYNANVRLVQ